MLAVLSQNIVLCCRRVWFGNQRTDTPVKICSVCCLQVCILNELITGPCSCQGHWSFRTPWCRIPESGEIRTPCWCNTTVKCVLLFLAALLPSWILHRLNQQCFVLVKEGLEGKCDSLFLTGLIQANIRTLPRDRGEVKTSANPH